MNRLSSCGTLLIAFALAACAPVESTPKQPPGTPVGLSGQDVKTVQAGVRAGMKDPDSARFGAMAAAKDNTGKVTVCGYVNGRNSFGGYTGDKPFIGIFVNEGGSKAFSLADIGSTEGNMMAISIVCKGRGVSI